MRGDLVNFLFDNLAELQVYDAAKIYHDNGQHPTAESLLHAIEHVLSEDAAICCSHIPPEYRLSHIACKCSFAKSLCAAPA